MRVTREGRARKLDREAFRSRAEELILSLGGRQIEELSGSPVFELDTPAGRLELHVGRTEFMLGQVFGRFDDPERVIEVLDAREMVNPYTGKWNHHFPAGLDVNEAILQLEHQMTRLLRAEEGESEKVT